MITEDYVSFETAKLLKENGFKGECSRFYIPNGYGRWKYGHHYDFDISERIECPTLQMAMKWLREVYNIHFSIIFSWAIGYNIDIHYINKKDKILKIEKMYLNDNYEYALETAIKYCLTNLI